MCIRLGAGTTASPYSFFQMLTTLAPQPLTARQTSMATLQRRLKELNTTPDGNNKRAYIYNQRRRAIEELNGPIWWVASGGTNFAGSGYLPNGRIYFYR